MTFLGDLDIRNAFKKTFRTKSDLFFDEFDLTRGSARVDLIHFGEHVTGYEIKSDRDNLDRLISQSRTYNRALEKIVLIVGAKHSEKVLDQVPQWWGLIEARRIGRRITFSTVRAPSLNPFFDPTSLLDLLWKDELVSILSTFGLKTGLNSKSKFELKSILRNISMYRELKLQVTTL